MTYKDYHAVLGVPREADLEQIKKAYRFATTSISTCSPRRRLHRTVTRST